jgi:hypothetical protein
MMDQKTQQALTEQFVQSGQCDFAILIVGELVTKPAGAEAPSPRVQLQVVYGTADYAKAISQPLADIIHETLSESIKNTD